MERKSAERAACQAAFFHENGNESDNRTRELFYLGNIIISWKRKKKLDSCWTQQSGWILHGYRRNVLLWRRIYMTMYHSPWRIEELFQKWQNFIKNQLPCTCSNNFLFYHEIFFGKIWGRKRTYQVFFSRKRGKTFLFSAKTILSLHLTASQITSV